MTGLTDHLAQIAHAAIDGGDHAERQIHRVEHRALLDMDFNKAEIISWIPFDFYYTFNSTLRRFYAG